MRIIGITGPTGAGKTTVLQALEGLGCVCVDCDRLYHRLLDTSPALRSELTERFGKSILNSWGQVDRKALGAVVFADPEALLDLNAIAHRHVEEACLEQVQQARAGGKKAIAFDAIALLESGLGQMCDVTVAVVAPDDIRFARIMARDGIDASAAKRRMAAQKTVDYYVNHCDYVIENDGSKLEEEIAREARQLFSEILC